ncbi:MAG: transcriptional regulator [Desulfarculus sp.]|nr:transcriptional regulator [Desulfarculus sp.]
MGLTLRQTMVRLLEQREMSALDLAAALLLTAREVEQHLPHLRQSLKQRLKVSPARCRSCGYVFGDRRRLDAPGRCPRCRQEMVDGPWFRVLG